jgi:mono/diheme cytochrome c family protein
MPLHPSSITVGTASAVLFGATIMLTPTLRAQDNAQWQTGKNLYEKVCGHCHKPEVGVGTPIQGRELPPEYVKYIVRNGFNAMPAFPSSYIDDASLELVAKYIGTLPGPQPQ